MNIFFMIFFLFQQIDYLIFLSPSLFLLLSAAVILNIPALLLLAGPGLHRGVQLPNLHRGVELPALRRGVELLQAAGLTLPLHGVHLHNSLFRVWGEISNLTRIDTYGTAEQQIAGLPNGAGNILSRSFLYSYHIICRYYIDLLKHHTISASLIAITSE